jgi:N-acetylornithine carbamoyltransferase
LTKRDFLAVEDWSPPEIEALLALALRIKGGEVTGGLEKKTLALVFSEPDPHVRAGLEIAMFLHGGHATAIELNGESDAQAIEVARTMAGLANGLAVRLPARAAKWSVARTDPGLKQLVASCDKPVINLESARRNPCQALADALTLRERLGQLEGKRFVLTWGWSPRAQSTAVAVSAALAAAGLGMEIVIARPEGYELDPEDTALIRRTTQQAGGEFVHISDDAEDALVGADVVYVASWGSVKLFDRPSDETAARGQLGDWRLTRPRLRASRGGRGLVMRAGPGNGEIDEAILALPNTAIADQVVNRLHVHRAILMELLGRGVAVGT